MNGTRSSSAGPNKPAAQGFETYREYVEALAKVDQRYTPMLDGLRNFQSESQHEDYAGRGAGSIELYRLEDTGPVLSTEYDLHQDGVPSACNSHTLVRNLEHCLDDHRSGTWLMVHRYRMPSDDKNYRDALAKGLVGINGSLMEMIGRRFDLDAQVLLPHYQLVSEDIDDQVFQRDIKVCLQQASERMSYNFPSERRHLFLNSTHGVSFCPSLIGPLITAQVLHDSLDSDTKLGAPTIEHSQAKPPGTQCSLTWLTFERSTCNYRRIPHVIVRFDLQQTSTNDKVILESHYAMSWRSKVFERRWSTVQFPGAPCKQIQMAGRSLQYLTQGLT